MIWMGWGVGYSMWVAENRLSIRRIISGINIGGKVMFKRVRKRFSSQPPTHVIIQKCRIPRDGYTYLHIVPLSLSIDLQSVSTQSIITIYYLPVCDFQTLAPLYILLYCHSSYHIVRWAGWGTGRHIANIIIST